MRFMTIVKGSEDAGQPPPALYAAIDALGREAAARGVMVGMGGLLPTAMGARARLAKGRITFTDGPFSEAKEVIGGFAIYDVRSKEEALDWTRRFLQVHLDHWPAWEGEVEVRQMFEGPPGA
jgi:hypothetical protein